jgi:hypothetical protein
LSHLKTANAFAPVEGNNDPHIVVYDTLNELTTPTKLEFEQWLVSYHQRMHAQLVPAAASADSADVPRPHMPWTHYMAMDQSRLQFSEPLFAAMAGSSQLHDRNGRAQVVVMRKFLPWLLQVAVELHARQAANLSNAFQAAREAVVAEATSTAAAFEGEPQLLVDHETRTTRLEAMMTDPMQHVHVLEVPMHDPHWLEAFGTTAGGEYLRQVVTPPPAAASPASASASAVASDADADANDIDPANPTTAETNKLRNALRASSFLPRTVSSSQSGDGAAAAGKLQGVRTYLASFAPPPRPSAAPSAARSAAAAPPALAFQDSAEDLRARSVANAIRQSPLPSTVPSGASLLRAPRPAERKILVFVHAHNDVEKLDEARRGCTPATVAENRVYTFGKVSIADAEQQQQLLQQFNDAPADQCHIAFVDSTVFSEGIDFINVGELVFLSPPYSFDSYAQMVGRVMRGCKNDPGVGVRVTVAVAAHPMVASPDEQLLAYVFGSAANQRVDVERNRRLSFGRSLASTLIARRCNLPADATNADWPVQCPMEFHYTYMDADVAVDGAGTNTHYRRGAIARPRARPADMPWE